MSPRRRCRRSRRGTDLVRRLSPYVTPVDDPPVVLVSAEPLRLFLLGWAAATGDRPEIVARGFGLAVEFVEDLLNHEIRRLDMDEATTICEAVRVDPDELWRIW